MCNTNYPSVTEQIKVFNLVCAIINDFATLPNITLVNPLCCNESTVPNGFPNSINSVDYKLTRPNGEYAVINLKIASRTSGVSFDSIEIVAIDSYPSKHGMGTELFYHTVGLAQKLGIKLMWGYTLDSDSVDFYMKMGCQIRNNIFRYDVAIP